MSTRDRSRPYRIGAALIAVALLALTACSTSSETGGGGSTDTTASPGTTSTGSDDLPLADIEELAQGALLTPSEVGPGFVAETHDTSESSGPAPCGTPRADTVSAPDVEVGATSISADGNLAFLEEIRYFQTTSQAQESFSAGVAGLNCSQGEVTGSDGQTIPVNISSPSDLTSELPDVDQAIAWSVNSTTDESQMVAILMGQLVVTMQFANSLGTDLSGAPDPLTVVQAAVQKILAS